ncbi:MAG: hypothetical protein NXI24_09625 [bacterium]|nr:hypothetical protein [bacterium]
MKLHSYIQKLRSAAAMIAVAAMLVAPLAGDLHFLVHDHGHGATANTAEYSNPGDDAGLAAECAVCNLPSHRLASGASERSAPIAPVAQSLHAITHSAAYARVLISRTSRGPPQIV